MGKLTKAEVQRLARIRRDLRRYATHYSEDVAFLLKLLKEKR